MKKLSLDHLAVDSFATSPSAPRVRGTVAAREDTGIGTCTNDTEGCPVSWEGTCHLTCFETCLIGCTGGQDCP